MKRVLLHLSLEATFQLWYYLGRHWRWADGRLQRLYSRIRTAYYKEKLREL